MPSIFELFAAVGVELSDEQKASIKLEDADEVKGLKDSRDKLLTESKEAKRRAKEVEEAARIAQEEAARKTGDVQALEQSLTKKYQGELEKRDRLILGGAKSGVIAELSGKFVAPDAAKLMLGSLVDVSYDEKGEVVTVFKGLDGQPVGTSAKDFEAYLAKEKAFAPMLVGTTSTGGGAPGSSGRGGAAGQSDYHSRAKAEINARFGKQ